ncbi:hypothetical protein C6569_01775 [Phreatobacter cathodiphilus]|uniref:DUF898 domain-containing protein n=2 Tax=Phreatobacter cathodiphilus TaxID=1868589 RepID=A0A2S0N7B3_9HYPH|nr:hypothetical protein C6569_01775 [Phreatobacter cathodiphilus]
MPRRPPPETAMTDAAPPGPWGPRSAAAAMAAAEQAQLQRSAATSVPRVAPAAATTPVAFTGLAGELLGLLVKGYLLQVVTLGIYRFWFITDVRRYYWSHSFVGREGIAYTGRGIELLKGFLIALAILVPIQAASFFVLLGLPQAEFVVSAVVFVLYLLLGQFAVYAGRRYRLTRTSFRGLRLRMTGSAWSYAFKAFGLWLLVILSLGLAFPWAAAIMERLKMRQTWYGDAQGDFVGTAGDLMKRGILIWLLAFGLPALMIGSVLLSIPPRVWSDLFAAVGDGTVSRQSATGLAIAALTGAGIISVVIPILLFPAFSAVVYRWRMNGTRIGGAALASSFTIGSSYRVYILGCIALLGILLLVAVAGAILFGGLAAAIFARGNLDFESPATGITGIAVLALAYILVIGTLWIAKQLVIDLRLQRARLASLSVLNLSALDGVTANNVDASAMGDSLGDAVDFGFGA